MKRKLKNSIAIALTVLLSVMTFVPMAQGHPPPERFFKDTGVVIPGMGQVLRITISPSTIPNGAAGNGAIRVRLRWMLYGAEGCSGMPAVCRHMVVSQGATAPETLGPGDALSLDVPGTGAGARLIVESESQDVRVNAVILDAAGNIMAFCCSGTLGSL